MYSANTVKIIIFTLLIAISLNFLIQGNITLKKSNYKNEKNLLILKNDDKNYDNNLEKISEDIIFNKIIKSEKKELEEILIKKIIIVKKNDTFSGIISPFLNNKLKNLVIKNLSKEFNLNNLNINQKIFLYENNKKILKKIVLPINFSNNIIVNIDNDKVNIVNEKIEIIKDIFSIKFVINTSLYKDGINAGVPVSVLIDLIKLYSFDIDFQRDIKKNNKLEVSYETLYNPVRNETAYGNIKYVNLEIQNKNLEYFIFKTDEGFYDYFNRKGKNVKKALLKTPLDGARLSSGFGMRKHPISGFNKIHKGVDFAAPTGTPIYAGGNGVIEYIGNNGGYGKYIRIRHNNEYKTAYAHLSKYKKNIYKGKRVSQGDIIGYVGSTGNSTGPHLHYEIIFQNKQVNPMNIKLPSGKILEGNELKRFDKEYKEIYAKHLFSLYE
tara:strand:- start:1037 stop:2350 length:1314 start_codon:yes stop_codon:yes gene_type:complete